MTRRGLQGGRKCSCQAAAVSNERCGTYSIERRILSGVELVARTVCVDVSPRDVEFPAGREIRAIAISWCKRASTHDTQPTVSIYRPGSSLPSAVRFRSAHEME